MITTFPNNAALACLAFLSVFLLSTTSYSQPLCNGQVATIVGTENDDNLVGTSGPDVIVGLGGNDTIRGRGGRDIICGGPGNDTILGNGGADTLFGEDDDDTINGGGGSDVIDGGAGINTIDGGNGSNDVCMHGDTNANCETIPTGIISAAAIGGGGSLIDVTNLAPGHATCVEGGTQIDAGLDDGIPGGTADDGILDPQEIDETSFACDGNQLLIDPANQGSPDILCATSTQVNVGLDNGDGGEIAGDGVLDPGEIDSSFFICDGLDGLQGATGPQGAQGPQGLQGLPGIGLPGPTGPPGPIGPTGATGAQGPTGSAGATGPTGPAGADGIGIAESVLSPIATMCPDGSTVAIITYKRDLDGNGVGDISEPNAFTFTEPCDGIDGADGLPGADGIGFAEFGVGQIVICPDGSTSLNREFKRDLDGDGVGESSEPTAFTIPAVCDGEDGATGPQGPQGLQGLQGFPGADGADGATGPQGPEGPEGPAGGAGVWTTQLGQNCAKNTTCESTITCNSTQIVADVSCGNRDLSVSNVRVKYSGRDLSNDRIGVCQVRNDSNNNTRAFTIRAYCVDRN